jgi:signal transduction histidine kinase
VLGAALVVLAVVELLLSDEQPEPTPVRALAAVVPPLLVVVARRRPRAAAALLAAVLVVSAVEAGPSGTFSAGLSWLLIVFATAAEAPRPWWWLGAVAAATVLRDVRTTPSNASDVVVDVVFLVAAGTAGRLVHRRAAQAAQLGARLRLADDGREEATREALARERALIARELHDIVAHSVSLMVVQAGTARPVAERRDAELAQVLATIESVGREALTELRRLLAVLRTETGEGLEPVPGIERVADLVEGFRAAGMDVRARLEPPAGVSAGIGLCGYRTVQEGLTNALRHAPGSRVDVTVAGDADLLTVQVIDTGGARVPDPGGSGTGLVGLRERVLLCGGRLEADGSGDGYRLQVSLPLRDAPIAADGDPP